MDDGVSGTDITVGEALIIACSEAFDELLKGSQEDGANMNADAIKKSIIEDLIDNPPRTAETFRIVDVLVRYWRYLEEFARPQLYPSSHAAP